MAEALLGTLLGHYTVDAGEDTSLGAPLSAERALAVSNAILGIVKQERGVEPANDPITLVSQIFVIGGLLAYLSKVRDDDASSEHDKVTYVDADGMEHTDSARGFLWVVQAQFAPDDDQAIRSYRPVALVGDLALVYWRDRKFRLMGEQDAALADQIIELAKQRGVDVAL